MYVASESPSIYWWHFGLCCSMSECIMMCRLADPWMAQHHSVTTDYSVWSYLTMLQLLRVLPPAHQARRLGLIALFVGICPPHLVMRPDPFFMFMRCGVFTLLHGSMSCTSDDDSWPLCSLHGNIFSIIVEESALFVIICSTSLLMSYDLFTLDLPMTSPAPLCTWTPYGNMSCSSLLPGAVCAVLLCSWSPLAVYPALLYSQSPQSSMSCTTWSWFPYHGMSCTALLIISRVQYVMYYLVLISPSWYVLYCFAHHLSSAVCHVLLGPDFPIMVCPVLLCSSSLQCSMSCTTWSWSPHHGMSCTALFIISPVQYVLYYLVLISPGHNVLYYFALALPITVCPIPLCSWSSHGSICSVSLVIGLDSLALL